MLTRLGCLFSVLLTLLSFAMLTLFVIVPASSALNDNNTFISFMGSLLCHDDETYRADAYKVQHHEGTNYTFTAYCDQPTGLARDVTDRQTIYGIIAFVAPFLIGLGLGIGSIAMASMRVARRAIREGSTLVVRSDYTPPDSRAPHSLSDRLQQLQEAYERGLISASEYERARRKLLDE